MGRSAIIFHGTGGDPGNCWYPWLGAQLEARGYAVEIPRYPGLNRDPIEAFLPQVLANHPLSEHTVLVGHSGGAALLLGILEKAPTQIVRDEGHFGDYDDPCPTFELLDRLID